MIRQREGTENDMYSDIIKGYQVLIKKLNSTKGTNDHLRQSLMSNFAPGLEMGGSSAEKVHQLNEDLRETYKKLANANERVVKLEKDNDVLKEANKRLTGENESMKIVLTDLKEKVEIRTKELSASQAEWELQNERIKELSADNASYWKKICELQSGMIEKMNIANQLYEEAKSIRQEGILSKNDESGFSDNNRGGLNLSSMINDNYFKIPSRTRYNIFAHAKEALCLSYTTQGTNIATGGGDGNIKIWDVEQGKEYGSLNKQKKAITALAFSPDDQYLVSCSLDRNIKLWKIATMREAISFSGHSDTINACRFSSSAKKLITGSSDRTIRLWDYGKGIATKTFPCTSSCFAIDNLPSETEIFSGHLDGTLRIWWAKNEEKIHEIKDLHGDAITSVTLTTDGNYVLTNSRDHTLKYVDVRKYQEIATFENDMYINGSNTNRATLNSSATYGAVGSRHGNVIIFEIKGEEIRVEEIYPDFHTACVNSIHWQPGASSFASIDASGSLLIWE